MKAKIQANPQSVLYSLGDAITMFPSCISEFIEAAIEASEPDDDTLSQIIQLAVTEYPDRVAEIAEAAVMASPDQVDVIRKAFMPPPKKAIVATPVVAPPENPSPIENFLARMQAQPPAPTEAPGQIVVPRGTHQYQTSSAVDPDDIAAKAMQTIDELLARLQNPDNEGTDLPVGVASPLQPSQVETFSVNTPDQLVGITTINDINHHDMIDEQIENPTDESLVIKDPITKVSLVTYLKDKIREKETETVVSPNKNEDIEFTSSVYHIPASGDSSQLQTPADFRSPTVSPTLPKAR